MEIVQHHSALFLFCLMSAVLLPLISALAALLIREKYSWLVSFTASFFLLLSMISAVAVFSKVWSSAQNVTFNIHIEWFRIGSQVLQAGILLDHQAAVMLLIVPLISFLVHVYSAGYMASDNGIRRYFAALGFFTFAMLGLVLADNILLVFFFWELVGFSSYLLIGHWSQKPEASAAARKAFIFNRIGDAGMLVGLMVIWANTSTFDIVTLHASKTIFEWQTAASLCLFCGVIGKSAQFPLLTWLPDAMEGPTPVSALIHAATMVAAGIFLLARMNFMFTLSALDVVAIVGTITALMAAASALVQYDIKKILAYSTISQLGLMVMAIGAGAPDAALLHLFTHAFFKACLFLCAGSIIHALHQAKHQHHVSFDVQDIRNLGGLRSKMPFTCIAMIVSGASLAGIPFFSGFLSKDAILTALATSNSQSWRYLILLSGFAVSFMTVLYVFRVCWLVFMGEERTTKNLPVEEPPQIMRAPIAILMAASLWFVVSWQPFDFEGWLMLKLKTSHEIPFDLGLISMLWVMLALAAAFALRNKKFESRLLMNSFYLDTIYRYGVAGPFTRLASISKRIDERLIDGTIHAAAYVQVTIANLVGWFDRVIVDGFVDMLAYLAQSLGAFTRSFQAGKIQRYIFWASTALIIFLIWTLF